MSSERELLTEIRDLLQLIAEPALAKRDARLRTALRTLAGSSIKKRKAVLLMDGTRTRPDIIKGSGLDQGDLSRLVKGLVNAELIAPAADEKHPQLVVKIPATFFDGGDVDDQ